MKNQKRRDMNHDREKLIEELIGRRLGISDEPERESASAPAEEIERILNRLDRTLAPLESWTVPEPRAELNASIMERIRSATQTISFERAAAFVADRPAPVARGWFFSIRDLVAAAACITILVGLFAPGYYHARRLAERSACQNNLAAVYAGMAKFGTEHDGRLPYSGAFAPVPAEQTGSSPTARQTSSNSRHLYVLIQGRYVNPRVFVCPAHRGAVPLNVQNPEQLADFPQSLSISYSYQQMAGPVRASLTTDPNLAVLADRNPLFDDDIVRRLRGPDQNSYVHGKRAGQNVVFTSGRVAWTVRPQVGVNGDNIWVPGCSGSVRTGAEMPECATDSFLVP